LLIFILDLISLYSGHVNLISCETSLYIGLGFIPRGIELFVISSLILCFAIDIDTSKIKKFFFKMINVNFHILKFLSYSLK